MTKKSTTFCEWVKNMGIFNDLIKQSNDSKLSTEVTEIFQMFHLDAMTAIKEGRGWATIMVLSEKDFIMKSQVGFNIVDVVSISDREAWTELSKIKTLVIHAIPEINSNIEVHIVATWDYTPVDDIKAYILAENGKNINTQQEKCELNIPGIRTINNKYLIELSNMTAEELTVMASEIKQLPEEEQESILNWYLDNTGDFSIVKIKTFLLEFEPLLWVIKKKNKPDGAMKKIKADMASLGYRFDIKDQVSTKIHNDRVSELNKLIHNWDTLSKTNTDNVHNLSTSERQDWIDELDKLHAKAQKLSRETK
jgi:hypothetical protein